MADLKSRKAKFEEVKFDKEALDFHADRYESGSVDKLAKQCHQWRMVHDYKQAMKSPYQVYTEQRGGFDGISIES